MPNPYLGHLMRISAIEVSEVLNPIRVPISLLPYDAIDYQGTGIWNYEFVELPGGEIRINWLDEITTPRYLTIRAEAFSYSDAWINVSRGQHDIKTDFEGGPLLQPDFDNEWYISYDQINFKITPIPEESGSPRVTFRKFRSESGYLIYESDDDKWRLSHVDLQKTVLDTTLYSVLSDTLTVNKNAGGTVLYTAKAILQIGSQFYLSYSAS